MENWTSLFQISYLRNFNCVLITLCGACRKVVVYSVFSLVSKHCIYKNVISVCVESDQHIVTNFIERLLTSDLVTFIVTLHLSTIYFSRSRCEVQEIFQCELKQRNKITVRSRYKISVKIKKKCIRASQWVANWQN